MQAAVYPSLVGEIKARLSILDLFQQRLVPVDKLRVSGDKGTCCCPLHDDRNPSFAFSLSKGLWYCFACAEGGDQVRLYARYHGISDKEAIQQLAAYLGLTRTLSPAEKRKSEQEARKREQEKFLEAKLETRIGEITHAFTDEIRAMERYLLVIRDVGKDPLQDNLCCKWLQKRDLCEYWLDQLTFGDAEAKIQALLEVLEWLDL